MLLLDIQMNLSTAVAGAVVLGTFLLALRYLWKQRKEKGPCAGCGADGCTGCVCKRQMDSKETKDIN